MKQHVGAAGEKVVERVLLLERQAAQPPSGAHEVRQIRPASHIRGRCRERERTQLIGCGGGESIMAGTNDRHIEVRAGGARVVRHQYLLYIITVCRT